MKFQIKKDGLTGETLKFAELMEGALDIAFNDATKGALTEKEVNNLISKALEGKGATTEQETTIKETAEAVRKQAAEIEKIKASGIETDQESFLDTLEKAKDELKQIQKNRTGMKTFTLKAAGVTTTATTGGTRAITNSVSAAGGQRLGDGPIYEIRRGKPFILDFVNLGSTTSSVLIWFDELAKEGDFAVTAEGVAKPMVQYRFERKSASYQKAAGYSTITDEFERDFPQLYTTIRRLMESDVRLAMASIILADVISAAPTFSYTGLNAKIDNADNYAAIGAAIAGQQALYFGDPNVLFLNPADAWIMKLQKTTTGEYVMPPFDWNGNTYAFGTVIVDPRITAGTFLIGDLNNYNVDLYGDVIVKIGYVNDDLIKNQFTVVVEQFFYDYISTNKLGGLTKGTFATIKTALETA
jgi:hypothetical protein